MAVISCRFCNKIFDSMIDSYQHNPCPEAPKHKIWDRSPGSDRGRPDEWHWQRFSADLPKWLDKENEKLVNRNDTKCL